ncbi:MAG: hypothetical protein ACRDAP_12990, partial [Shewanella sp.]
NLAAMLHVISNTNTKRNYQALRRSQRQKTKPRLSYPSRGFHFYLTRIWVLAIKLKTTDVFAQDKSC